MAEQISLLVAFGAGLLSFISPCVLPLVPVYLASLFGGPELFESKVKKFHVPLFFHSLAFVLGFSLMFSLWGAGAGLIGSSLVTHLSIVRQVVGGLLILFGLFMLASQKVAWLNFEKRLNPAIGGTTGYLRSFLTGGIFSVAWIPCVSPILGGILALALNTATIWQGAYLLGIYSLGLGIPFLIIAIAFDFVMPFLKWTRRYSAIINIISAILLIAMGILTATNNLLWLQPKF